MSTGTCFSSTCVKKSTHKTNTLQFKSPLSRSLAHSSKKGTSAYHPSFGALATTVNKRSTRDECVKNWVLAIGFLVKHGKKWISLVCIIYYKYVSHISQMWARVRFCCKGKFQKVDSWHGRIYFFFTLKLFIGFSSPSTRAAHQRLLEVKRTPQQMRHVCVWVGCFVTFILGWWWW